MTHSILRLITLASLCLLLSCAHLQHLDRAQNAFNRGAEMENFDRYGFETEALASPVIHYQLAYREVKEALKKPKKLRNAQLLGHAHALKALTEWQLQLYEAASRSSRSALSFFDRAEAEGGVRLARDRAVMEALPALVQLDSIRKHLFQFFRSTEVPLADARSYYLAHIHHPAEDRTAPLAQALQMLEQQPLPAGSSDNLRVYFLQAQLAGLQTWDRALDYIRKSIRDAELEGDALAEADTFYSVEFDEHLMPRKRAALEQLKLLLPKGQEHPVYRFWSR